MNSNEFIIKRRPKWLIYPQKYLELIIKQQEDSFLPWFLTVSEDFSWTEKDLKKRYPKRNLFCFARKAGTDDMACWEKCHGEKVFIIHDFASTGWEQRQIFDCFDDWHE